METNILKEAAVVMGILVVSYLVMLGLFVVLFRIFFPVQKENLGKETGDMVNHVSRNIRKAGRTRKMKLANG